MRKYLFVIIIDSIFLTTLFAETQLEKLWENAKEFSTDLHSAEFKYKYSELALKHKRSLYPFSLNSVISSSFNDSYENLIWYTDSTQSTLTVLKKNPFGNSVSLGISYSINRGFLDFSVEKINSDSIGYSHIPTVNLSINQSLFPAIINGKKDPNVEMLKKNISSAFFSKNIIEKSLIESVTNYYIQARCINRQLEKYKNYIDFYDLKIKASKELFKNAKISISEIWSLENKRWEYYQNYVETLNSKQNIELSLKNICGENIECILSDSCLPNSEIKVLSFNPSKELVINEIEILNIQNTLTKESMAPTLSIAGSFSEGTKTKDSFIVNYVDDKNLLNWNFSLGINFSDFFSPTKKLQNQLFQSNLKICEEKLLKLNKEIENQKNNYQEIILIYEKQLQSALKIHKNRLELEEDCKKLFMAGKCSQLELQEIHLNTIESECIYKNLMDNLWFYKWKRRQCI